MLCNRCMSSPRIQGSHFCNECRSLCSKCKSAPRTSYSSRCKACNAAYWRDADKKRRAKRRAEAPTAHLCLRCASAERADGSHFCAPCKRLCAKCLTNHRAHRHRYCNDCRNAHARATRKNWRFNEEDRRKDNCRAYANVYLKRGKLVKQPCEVCGSPESQMHHDDYSKPLEVRWLCRRHHLYLHEDAKAAKPSSPG